MNYTIRIKAFDAPEETGPLDNLSEEEALRQYDAARISLQVGVGGYVQLFEGEGNPPIRAERIGYERFPEEQTDATELFPQGAMPMSVEEIRQALLELTKVRLPGVADSLISNLREALTPDAPRAVTYEELRQREEALEQRLGLFWVIWDGINTCLWHHSIRRMITWLSVLS
jgi:hypothetical protein